MLVTLTGFMGSGKTTVGKVLADFLGCPFYDLDELIVKKAGKGIPEIFADGGEAGFRALEAEVLRKTVAKYAEATAVLSLGGGTLGTPASARLVAEKTTCIFLRAGVDTLAARLAPEAAGRPLLAGAPDLRERIAALLSEREATYAATAHVTVDTDGLSPEEIADEIVISCL